MYTFLFKKSIFRKFSRVFSLDITFFENISRMEAVFIRGARSDIGRIQGKIKLPAAP